MYKIIYLYIYLRVGIVSKALLSSLVFFNLLFFSFKDKIIKTAILPARCIQLTLYSEEKTIIIFIKEISVESLKLKPQTAETISCVLEI